MGTGVIEFALYLPIFALAIVWASLTVAGNVTEGRGNSGSANTLRDLGFGAMLLAGAWCVVLVVLAAIQLPTTSVDGLLILAVAFVFFALLVGVLVVLTEFKVAGRAIGSYLLGLVGLALVVLIVLAIL
ncbi:MAG: hypothetical protein H0U20_06675 [Thermoleophilaceae bacterium]|nr:hypothetical protein [Thermoleophilaceae bacterium]